MVLAIGFGKSISRRFWLFSVNSCSPLFGFVVQCSSEGIWGNLGEFVGVLEIFGGIGVLVGVLNFFLGKWDFVGVGWIFVLT